jgi:hypothetical protein
MSNPTIEISKQQIISALAQFTPKELKQIIDKLFRQKAFSPPKLEEITREAVKTVRREKLKPATVEEAIKWARRKR